MNIINCIYLSYDYNINKQINNIINKKTKSKKTMDKNTYKT